MTARPVTLQGGVFRLGDAPKTKLAELDDVSLAGGHAGDVLTQQPDGSYAPEPAPAAGGWQTGDTLTTARSLGEPQWLPCNGDVVDAGAYPDLADLLPKIVSFDAGAEKLADPAALPTGNGRVASFSPDGSYLAIPHAVTPFVAIYAAGEAPAVPNVGGPLPTYIKT